MTAHHVCCVLHLLLRRGWRSLRARLRLSLVLPAVSGDVGCFGYDTWNDTTLGCDVRLRALRLLENVGSAIISAVQMAAESPRMSYRGRSIAHVAVLTSVLLIYKYKELRMRAGCRRQACSGRG